MNIIILKNGSKFRLKTSKSRQSQKAKNCKNSEIGHRKNKASKVSNEESYRNLVVAINADSEFTQSQL